VQPLLAGKSSFERIFLGVSYANFSDRASTCNVRPFEVVIERFCQTAPVQVPTGRWRQGGCRPVWLVTVAIYFIARIFFYRFLETFCLAQARTFLVPIVSAAVSNHINYCNDPYNLCFQNVFNSSFTRSWGNFGGNYLVILNP